MQTDNLKLLDKGYSSTKNSQCASLAERIRKMYRNQAVVPPSNGVNIQNGSSNINGSNQNAYNNLNNSINASSSRNNASKGNLKDLLDNFYKRNSKSPQRASGSTLINALQASNILQTNNTISNNGSSLLPPQQQYNGKISQNQGNKPSEGLKNYVTNIIMKKISQEDLKNNQENVSDSEYNATLDINNSQLIPKKKSHSINNKNNQPALGSQATPFILPGQRQAYSNQRSTLKTNEFDTTNLNKKIGNGNSGEKQSFSPCSKAAIQYHHQQHQQQQQQKYPQQQMVNQYSGQSSNSNTYFQEPRGIEMAKSPKNSQSVQKRRQKGPSQGRDDAYGDNNNGCDNFNFSQLNASSHAFNNQTLNLNQTNIPSQSSTNNNATNKNMNCILNTHIQTTNETPKHDLMIRLNSSTDFLKNYSKIIREKGQETCTNQTLKEQQLILNQNSKRTLSSTGKTPTMTTALQQTQTMSQNYQPFNNQNIVNSQSIANIGTSPLNSSQFLQQTKYQQQQQLQQQQLLQQQQQLQLQQQQQQQLYLLQQQQQQQQLQIQQQPQQFQQQSNQYRPQKQPQTGGSSGSGQVQNQMGQIKVSSTKENKKIEFPLNIRDQMLTCDNKRKQNEHFQFDFTNNGTKSNLSNNQLQQVPLNNLLIQTNNLSIQETKKSYDPQQITTTVTNTQVYDCEENTTTAKKQQPSQATLPESSSSVSTQLYNPFSSTCTLKDFADNIKFLLNDSKSFEPDKFLSAMSDEMDGKIPNIDPLLNLKIIESPRKLDKTAKFKEEYLVGKQVGQGAYASVRVALNKLFNKKVAIKIYEKERIKEPQRKKSVRREIKLLQMLRHDNVIKIYDTIETNNHVNIIMEYIPGTSLHGYLKAQPKRRLVESDAKRIFRQLVSSIEYCHSKQICHRDIKLENILLDENNAPKLIDFGFSTCIPNDKKYKMFCGTPSYMGPEIVNKLEYTGPPADIWALGVLLYALLCGTFPFKGQTDKELYKKITNGDFFAPDFLSKDAKDFIKWILNVNCSERPTATEILAHWWLSEKKKTLVSQQTPPCAVSQSTQLNTSQNSGYTNNTYSENTPANQNSNVVGSNTILVNNYLQQNSPFNMNLKQIKFQNPQRTPSSSGIQFNNAGTPSNSSNKYQNIQDKDQSTLILNKSAEKDKIIPINCLIPNGNVKNCVNLNKINSNINNSNPFYYPGKFGYGNQTTTNCASGNNNNNYFISNKNIVVQLQNHETNSPTTKPPLPLSTKSASTNHQTYFLSSNNTNYNNINNSINNGTLNTNNNNTFCENSANYNNAYSNLQRKKAEVMRTSHEYTNSGVGDCTYIQENKNNLSSNGFNANPYNQSQINQGSTNNMTTFALHHLHDDEPINSIDSDVLKSIIYMGYTNDEETLVNGIRDPQNVLNGIYKNIYNQKVHTNKTIYPSHIRTNSYIQPLSSVKSPTSSSTNNSSSTRGARKVISFVNTNQYAQEQNTSNQSFINNQTNQNQSSSSSKTTLGMNLLNSNNQNNVCNTSFLNSNNINKLYDQETHTNPHANHLY